jgi:putative two-component system response regulator
MFTPAQLVDVERREAAARGVHLEAVVDASNEAIMSADADGLIRTWNRAATELYGYTKDEIFGRPVSVLSAPDRVREQRLLMQRVARGQVSVEFDTQHVHKDGSRLDISVTISRIMQGGVLSGFCAVTHDIAARVRLRDALEERIREGNLALFRSRAETLKALALAAEYRDYDTAKHTERVGESAALLAAGMGLPESQISLIREAAPLHDVGKIGIPDEILLKPGRLNAAEFDAIKQHTILGARLLAGSRGEILQFGEQIAQTHHERWDGLGYPCGLAGEGIPIAGRIVAVADSFDAMTHERPYRHACPIEEALTEMTRCSGTQFDPRVTDAFLRLRHGETNERLPADGRRIEPSTSARRGRPGIL